MVRIVSPIGGGMNGLGQAFSSLTEALDPSRQARAVAAAEQGRYARVRADTDQYQLDQLRDAQDRIRGSGATGADQMAAFAGAAGPGAHWLTNMPQYMLLQTTRMPGVTPDQIDNAQLGAGQAYQNTHAGRVQAEAAARDRAVIGTGPGYASVAENRRQFEATPVAAVGPDGNPIYVPRSRLGAAAEDGVPLYRPPQTLGQVQGQVAAQAVRPGAEPMVAGVDNRIAVLSPGTAGGIIRDDNRAVTWRLPDGSMASGPEGSMPEGAVLANRYSPAGAGRTLNPLTVPTGPTFSRAIDEAVRARINASPTPELMMQLQQEIAPLFQSGEYRGNLPGAIDAVLDRYQPQGVGNPFSRNTLVPRAALPPGAAPAYGPAGSRPAAMPPAPTEPTPTYAPAGARPAAAPARPTTTSDLPRVADDAGFAALPRGARFIAPDGSVRQKP